MLLALQKVRVVWNKARKRIVRSEAPFSAPTWTSSLKGRFQRVFLWAPLFEAALASGPVTLLEAAFTLPLAALQIADDRALQLTMPPHDDAMPPCFRRASRSRGGSVSRGTHAGGDILSECAQRDQQQAQRHTNSQERFWHRHGRAPW